MSQLVQYLPKKAYEHLQENDNAFLIDVRTEAENKFVGRPLDCIFVLGWMSQIGSHTHKSSLVQ